MSSSFFFGKKIEEKIAFLVISYEFLLSGGLPFVGFFLLYSLYSVIFSQ